MRKIYTLFLFCISSFCLAQTNDTAKVVITGNCWGANKTDRKPVPLDEGVKGKITGLNVQAAKKDTVNQRIRLRCGGSIDYGNLPLFIMDGITVENEALTHLKPGDIESIEVLKDAAAQAIYGCRGNHGVIIITTKKSRFRKFVIKDFLSGESVPGATVSFISRDRNDTLMYVGLVAEGRFRQDLYYRIRVVEIEMPPLRDRGRDETVEFGRHFAETFARVYKRPRPVFDPAFEAWLGTHTFPGNVRELEHAVESAVALSPDGVLRLPDEPRRDGAREAATGAEAHVALAHGLRLDEVSRRYAEATLARAGGNKSEAARHLGVSRNTLARLLEAKKTK